MDLLKALKISSAGMNAQSTRMRVSAENMANVDTMPNQPGGEPYRRKTITFRNVLDRALGVKTVQVGKIGVDKSAFEKRYDPSHPMADKDGHVLMPNVNSLVEMMDIREAQRSYEANLGAIEAAKNMLMRAVDLLRS
jgi:flagellar basal-body rod protein FlgC